MKDATTPIISPDENLKSALANEAVQKASHDEKKGLLAAAVSNKEKLIASAAAGAKVAADDVLRSDAAVRNAEIEAQIAEQVHAGAVKLRHEAEIQRWFAEAEMLDAQIRDAETARIQAGAKVDSAFVELKKAVDEFNVTGTDLWSARIAAGHFNASADVRSSGNAILAAAERGNAPVARGNYRAGSLNPLEAMVYNRGAMAEFRGHVGSVAAREAATFSRPDLIVSQPGETI